MVVVIDHTIRGKQDTDFRRAVVASCELEASNVVRRAAGHTPGDSVRALFCWHCLEDCVSGKLYWTGNYGRQHVSSDTVLFDLTDQVAVITPNRPAVRNAMNRELSHALMEALQRVQAEADIRAAIITGAGRTFCAGADLKERAQIGRAADASVASVIEANQTTGLARMVLEKPCIAAIDGYCLAAGFELALLCDLRLCTPDAKFGLPEITRGFFPGGGGPQRLMRAIPLAVAMEMILTGDPIDAPTAQQVGLVSRIVPAEAVISHSPADRPTHCQPRATGY